MDTTAPSFPSDFLDPAFEIKLDDNFLMITSPSLSPSYYTFDNYACYTLAGGGISSLAGGGLQSKFRIALKSFNTSTYNLYKTTASSSTYVSTYVHIKGLASGLTKTFEVRIEQ